MTRLPPRPRAPGLFTVLDIGRDQLERPIHYFQRLGDTFRTSLFGTVLVATRDPHVFEDVLVRQHKRFIKDEITRGLSKLLGQGLLTSHGEPWQQNRRLLQPHFQPQQLDRYLPVFREEAERELDGWPSEGTLDLHPAMARLSMRIALRTLFGTEAGEYDEFEQSMRDAMWFFAGFAGTSVPLPLSIPTPTNRRFLRARSHLNEALRRILTQARTQGVQTSVLGSLLSARASGELSEQQLVDEAITMLLAGHETTALTLTYALALLARAPEQQRALREELSGSVPESVAALRALPGVNRALKESLRLYPPAWAIGREALEDSEIAGFTVPKGAQVILYQWAAHRHPKWFEEPLAFRPGRWTRDFEASLPRHLYAPFGGGPRICIGNHFALAEMVIALVTLLDQFELQAPEPFAPRFITSITLRPRDPVRVGVRRLG